MIYNSIEEALQESRSILLNSSNRSNEKLYPLHGYVGQSILDQLLLEEDGDAYGIDGLSMPISSKDKQTETINGKLYFKGKEKKIKARYYDKKTDLLVYKNKIDLMPIFLKSVVSNYKQNSHNYFDNMLGESVSSLNAGMPVAQVFFCPHKVPYYDKGHTMVRMETISKKDLDPYVKLSVDYPTLLISLSIYDVYNDNVAILDLIDTFGISKDNKILKINDLIKGVARQCVLASKNQTA